MFRDATNIFGLAQTARVKHTRLQIALVFVLLVGASLLVLGRCAGEASSNT